MLSSLICCPNLGVQSHEFNMGRMQKSRTVLILNKKTFNFKLDTIVKMHILTPQFYEMKVRINILFPTIKSNL